MALVKDFGSGAFLVKFLFLFFEFLMAAAVSLFLPPQGDQYVVQKQLHPAKLYFTPTSIWTIPRSIPLIHR